MQYPVTAKTNKIHIRPLTEEDDDWWKYYFSSEQCMQYMPPSLLDHPNPAKAWIQKQLSRYNNEEFGLEVLIDIHSHECVGQSGLVQQIVDGKTHIEIGYHLLDTHWKNGYAQHAAKFFRDLAFSNLGINELISIIHCQNLASQKVAIRIGMQKWKQTTFKDFDVFIFKIDKEQWKNQF